MNESLLRRLARALPTFVLGAVAILLAGNLWRISQPPRPDPRMVNLAVRATVYALPTPTPWIVEVTRVVTPTVGTSPTPVPTNTPTPAPPATATPTISPDSIETPIAPDAAANREFTTAGAEPLVEELPTPEPTTPPMTEAEFTTASIADAPTVTEPTQGDCPTSSDRQYTTIPIAGGGLDHIDYLHADLNLAVRGYSSVDVELGLQNKNGPVDADPPQLATIFSDRRAPAFAAAFQVNDWNWQCGPDGCQGAPLPQPATTLMALESHPGEPITIPYRNARIFEGDYKALVLYAEPTRLTIGYTREDTVANGYVVHLENICVDPALVAQYQATNAAGRGSLPALRDGEILGSATQGNALVAIRDRGAFTDPRSRLDWWQGY